MLSADQGQYDKKKLIRCLVVLGVLTILGHFTHGLIMVIAPLLIFAAISQRKSVDSLFWILYLVFCSVGNRYFFAQSATALLLTRATLMGVTVVLMFGAGGRRAPAFVHPLLGLFLYIGWEAIVSAQGYAPGVSYMKLLLFVPLYLSGYAIACDVTASTRANAKLVRTVVLSIIILIIGGSMALMFVPSIGQMSAAREGADVAAVMRGIASGESVSLFCGMCAHSQALGPLIAILSSLVFADFVFGVRRKDWIYIGLLVSCPYLVYKTSSRTAMGTYVMGMGLVTLLLMQARAVGARWKGKVLMIVFTLGFMGLAAGLAVPSIRNRALSFVLKTAATEEKSAADMTFENVTSSREGLVQESLEGFRRKPLIGNGYQVAWYMQYMRRRGIKDYISAPIEKGVWPTAVLEEGGIIGLVLFAGFLLVAMSILYRKHAYCGLSVLWTFMFANFGEFSFFSMSYVGGFYWLLVFTGLILDGQRMKTVGLQPWDVPIKVVMQEVGMPEWMRRRG